MTCTGPDCPGPGGGHAPLFAIRHAALYPLPEGKLPLLFDDDAGPFACPYCGRSQMVREYLPLERQEMMSRLREELNQAYRARNAARVAGREPPHDVRAPGDIIGEINAIPRVFLVDKDAVYPENPEPAPVAP